MAIKHKYGFKQWLKRNYPDISADPIYGISAYTISSPMNDIDAFTYYQTPLDSGQYIVFIGMEADEISRTITSIKKYGLPERPSNNRRDSVHAPTTFTAFEAWLDRNGLKYRNRSFQPHKSPQEILAPLGDIEEIKGCADVFYSRTWYLYEIECDDHYFEALPRRTIDSGTAVLVKASSSKYKSKRDRLTENFNTMQTYMEQMIVALAKGDDQTAVNSAQLYCAFMFECNITDIVVDVKEMKEKLDEGTLSIYLRDRSERCRPRGTDSDSEDF